ncbi:uncharacterized protein LOC111377458 [Olea europaea var. sylvestris]|uniref:uncharacterized protein LOC111377458 n=1 Tax=Olea europaea var. sylvestris TaxID=158386 RepID=UPI000C1D6394|nr:uncharacterized protein LOC111377458 [Olea europaea var. sylvestris]
MAVDIKCSTMYAETAHQLWKELEQRLAQQNAPRIFELKQSIANLMQNQDSVSMYFSKLKTLLDELLNYESVPNCYCGGLKVVVNNQQRDWVMKFLMGLNDTYKGLKAQILLIKPFPNLNEVYSIVQQEEKRREISTESTLGETMALLAKGNFDVRTQNQSSQKKDRYYCNYCKITGHSLEWCFKANPNKPTCHKSERRSKTSTSFANQATILVSPFHEQVSNKAQIPLTQEQYTQLMALLKPQTNHNFIPSANHVQTLPTNAGDGEMPKISVAPWILNTGATDHMICSASYFTTIKAEVSYSVALPNGEDLLTWKTTGMGEVKQGLYHLMQKEASPLAFTKKLKHLTQKTHMFASSVFNNAILDDFSRCTWVYMLKFKSDAGTILQSFCYMIETQFECKVKTIRSDNGSEFEMKQFYSQKGIIYHKTSMETPQQNSIVERKHQHILNVARALKFQSTIPLKYWSDCVLTAVYLINRTPTPILDQKTPF